ncbi:MAG: cytochrome C6 [Synechococcus sp. MED-G71]|nr:MAG: cytochrome C6 [Synechococcus sp. MED-G71]|tara:strand:+ start:10669 stop:11004 length:336 start_codon:yes stop_codon:yes gene_type:complete
MVLLRGLMALLLMLGIWSAPAHAAADGASLFEAHCVGCHLNGGNIIRRGKTLQLKALERNGIQGPLEIAIIATEGRGQMSGYGEVLGEGGAEAVAEWIWQQAQNEWSSPDS